MEPKKPCSWHGVVSDTGKLKIVYCDAGPDGHAGGHTGFRSEAEYLRMLRDWVRYRNVQRRGQNGTVIKSG